MSLKKELKCTQKIIAILSLVCMFLYLYKFPFKEAQYKILTSQTTEKEPIQNTRAHSFKSVPF